MTARTMTAVTRMVPGTLILLGLAGSASAEDTAGATIGYSVGTVMDQFQAADQAGILAQAKAAGFNMLPPVAASFDVGKQTTDFHTLIGRGAKGIIFVASDSSALAPALEYAKQHNVSTIAVDNTVVKGPVSIIVTGDNTLMGRLACEEMGARLKGKGKVLELQGELSFGAVVERTDGFEGCMKEKFPGIEIIARPTHWDVAKTADVAQTTLAANSDLAGIYMQSDSVQLAPVLSAVEQAGHKAKVGEDGHIVLVAIDGSPAALAAIRDKRLDATISQPLTDFAKYSVAYLKRAIAGETFSPGKTDHNSQIVEFHGNLMDLLPSVKVSAANVEDPSLWGNQGPAK